MAIITISRQYGAGGVRVGRLVADCLGYRLIDQTLINQVAKDAKVPIKSVREIEKTAGDFWHSLFTELAANLPVVKHVPGIKSEFGEDKYRLFLKRTMMEIAARDNAVIIGRGGQMILKDHPRTLRFYLVAKDEDRVTYLMKGYGYNREKAETVALKEEKKRLAFVEGFGCGDPNDPKHYHMVFNTSLVKDDQISQIMCRLVGELDAGK
jgi:cytidylate kinase